MCRILMVRSNEKMSITTLLNDFAAMCKNSQEWQGDGWGVSWKLEDRSWKVEKSLKPIWEDKEKFDQIPQSNMFIVHARGASFPSQKGDIGFNQPYVDDDLCFVFNGELYGVSIKAEGKIGAQKIFSLIKKYLDKDDPKKTLIMIQDLLINNSKGILGLNVGFVLDDNFYVSCYFGDDNKKDYYTVRYFENKTQTIICSEKISNFPWKNIGKGEVVQL